MIPLLAPNMMTDAKPLPGKAPPAAEDFHALLRTVASEADAPASADAPEEGGASGKSSDVATASGTGQSDFAQLSALIAAMTGVAAPASGASASPASAGGGPASSTRSEATAKPRKPAAAPDGSALSGEAAPAGQVAMAAPAPTTAVTLAMLAALPAGGRPAAAHDKGRPASPEQTGAAPSLPPIGASMPGDGGGGSDKATGLRLGPADPKKAKPAAADDAPIAQHPSDASQVFAALGGKDAVPRGDGAALVAGSAAPMGEVMVTHHLDLAKDSAWLDQLTQDIVRSADAGGAIRFSLAPEHLGRLDVSMAQTADGTALRLTTETREAHRIVSDAQPRLVAEARAQGLTLSETSVDLGRRADGGQPQAFGNQNSGGGGHAQHAGWQPGPTAPASVTEQTPAAGRDDDLYA